MVKEISVTLSIPDCTVQEFSDVVFERKATLMEYHKREGDPDAVLSAWENDTRIITFSVPLSGVPDVVKTAIGCSTLTIRETQQREWMADGSLRVTSDPVLDIVGGSKFTTSAEFTVRDSAGQPGCEVTAKVLCSAAGPWGLVSTIESIMAQQAEASVQSFLQFCALRCTDGAQPLPEYSSDADTAEFYQDAAEAFPGAHAGSADLSGVDLQRLEPLLERLDMHAQGMQASISALCSALRSSSTNAPKQLAVGSSVASSWSDTSVGTSYWLALLLAFLAGCCLGSWMKLGPRHFR